MPGTAACQLLQGVESLNDIAEIAVAAFAFLCAFAVTFGVLLIADMAASDRPCSESVTAALKSFSFTCNFLFPAGWSVCPNGLLLSGNSRILTN